MKFSDLVIASLGVVVPANLLRLASSGTLQGWAGEVGKVVKRLLDPSIPLIDYPPGDPRRKAS